MKSATPMPKLCDLQATYIIDPISRSGLSRFKASIGRNGKVGPVISMGTDGYYRMQFNSKFYRTHRIIYFMHHGVDPGEKVIDHIDGDPTNNRIENLRACTQQENIQNARKRGTGSLAKGVTKRPNGMFRAQISIRDEIHIMDFSTLRSATRYLGQLRKRYHGEFARN